MVAQHKVAANLDDRKKMRSLSIESIVDSTWIWLFFGYIFLRLLWQWVSPAIELIWLVVEKWREFLHYH